MSERGVAQPPAKGATGVQLKKKIVAFEESDPASEPLFMNYAHVAQAGGSAYIDVGIIPLDELLESPATEATFLVLTRLVMSMQTLTALRDQISSLLESTPGDTGGGLGA